MKVEPRCRARRCVRALQTSLLVAVLAGLSACVSAPVPADRGSAMAAPVIHVVRYVSIFSIMTPKDAGARGLLGSATGSSDLPSGVDLEHAYRLPSAADAVSEQLVRKLSSEAHLDNLQVEDPPLPLPWSEETDHYRETYASGLVLEVNAQEGALYQPFHWRTYMFGMSATVRLIRPADGTILWKHGCATSRRDEMTLDVTQFEANDGARLKELIALGADECSRMLVDDYLGKRS